MAGLFSNITVLSLILLVAGFVLVTIEMFIPGFGVIGMLGIVCFIASVIVTAQTLMQGLIMASFIILILAVLFIIFLILVSQGIVPQKLILKAETNKKNSLIGAEERHNLVGKKGITLTPLRPAGHIDCEGERIDVVTKGDYIDKGVAVTVKEVDGNRIIVTADK